ncbi:hypothetical protein CL651_001495 [bacterium]|nr:hypothetical protein [bacterium]
MKFSLIKRPFFIMGVSIFFFCYMTGFSINYINPKNIDWIFFVGNDDASISWFGWEFFRWTDLIQFPLLDNYFYGEELNISLIYSGSVPLFALLFKPFDTLLSFPFQYYGIWHLTCLFLQSYFSLKIIERITDDKYMQALFLFVILLTPLLPFNLIINHVGLFANWIIIAALYLYIREGFSYKHWLILIVVSILTMAYLFAMILPIFIADLVKNKVKKNISTISALKFLSLTVLIILSIFPLLGIETSEDTYFFYKGYGHFRMNLNSIVDPSVFIDNFQKDTYIFSKVIPDLPDTSFFTGSGDYEGFNFIGLPIILILITIALFFKKQVISIPRIDYLPIVAVCLIFILYSLSNKIIFNDSLLFSYPLPGSIKDFFGVFRSSGRFFWPVYYILAFFSFYLFCSFIKKKKGLPILALIVIFGFFDSSNIYKKTREIKSFKLDYDGSTWQQMLKDPKWALLGKSYKKIKLIYPEIMPGKNSKKITLFALSEGLSVNGGYLARIKKTSLIEMKKRLEKNIQNCHFDSDSLYIFTNKKVWDNASRCSNKNLKLVLDNIYVIAPEIKNKD